ncbi:MAG: cation transporter, partial [Marinobacter sp.]|nr:cation transporter [Marinobacter sp.]
MGKEFTPAKAGPGGERRYELVVPGMGSDHCAGIITKTLRRLDGISDVSTNVASHRVSVSADRDGPDADALKRAVEGAGYDVASAKGAEGTTYKISVPGMGSDHCAGIIRSTLEREEGVREITTNVAGHSVTVVTAPEGP